MLHEHTMASWKMPILQLLRQKYVASEKLSTYLAVKGLPLHCRPVFSKHLGTNHLFRLMQSHSKILDISSCMAAFSSPRPPPAPDLALQPFPMCNVLLFVLFTWKLACPSFPGCIISPCSGGRAVSGKRYMQLQLILTALETTAPHDQGAFLQVREVSPLSTA